MRYVGKAERETIKKLGWKGRNTLVQLAGKIYKKACMDCRSRIMADPRNAYTILCHACKLECEEELRAIEELNKKLREA